MLIEHSWKAAGGNANGLLACPFRLADNNAKSNDSRTGECDCRKLHSYYHVCLMWLSEMLLA